MRIRNLALAILLSTTCLAGSTDRAEAGPLVVFAQGFWTGLTTGVAAGAGIGGAFAAGMNVGSWLASGTLLARLVVSVGVSALMGQLNKPKIPPAEYMANYAQPVSWVEWVYGRVRKGGPFALSAFSRAGAVTADYTDAAAARRHYGVIIAGHSTRGPVTHYLDKWEVETGTTGLVTTAPISNRARIRTYRGQAGQAADPVWRAVFPEVGAGDDFAGLSYAALYATRPADSDFPDIYPNGREWAYAPVWDGCDTVYDPRSATNIWTDNAALVIADVAVRIFGKSVDWDEVAAEADISDQLVTNRDGGTQRRWTINTVVRADQTWEDVRTQLQMCCDAFFYERRDGKLGFKVGYYAAPTVTLTDRDFLSLSIRHKAEGPDRPGSYALRYVEPARDWEQEVSGAVIVNATGPRSEAECYGITSHNQAWRVSYRTSRVDYAEWAISATLRPKGYECMEERFLRINHSETGLDCVVEVGTLGRIGGSHTWQLEAVSVEAGDWTPDALTLEPPRTLRAAIAEDGTVPAPASLAGEVIEGTGGVALIEYAWPAQTEDLTQQLRVRSTDAGLPDWQILTVPSGQGSYVLSGLVDGADYEAQVRNRTSAGRLSLWAPETPLVITAVANTDPPPAVTGFAATVAGSTVELDWTAPNSSLYSAARIWRASGAGAVIGDAVLVRVEFGAPSLADGWTDPGPGTGSWRYWIEPINASGIGGPMSGPATVTII